MKADLIYRHRLDFDDGAIIEIVIWKLEHPVEGCNHPYKYRLYYGKPGVRILGYDNERPKGDHCHRDGNEQAYVFDTPEKLVNDFLGEVQARRQAS
jgi:hypothetical protein